MGILSTLGNAVEKAEEAVASSTPKPKVVGSKIFTPMSSDPSSINLVANEFNYHQVAAVVQRAYRRCMVNMRRAHLTGYNGVHAVGE